MKIKETPGPKAPAGMQTHMLASSVEHDFIQNSSSHDSFSFCFRQPLFFSQPLKQSWKICCFDWRAVLRKGGCTPGGGESLLSTAIYLVFFPQAQTFVTI